MSQNISKTKQDIQRAMYTKELHIKNIVLTQVMKSNCQKTIYFL